MKMNGAAALEIEIDHPSSRVRLPMRLAESLPADADLPPVLGFKCDRCGTVVVDEADG
jgi:hypothetical protein